MGVTLELEIPGRNLWKKFTPESPDPVDDLNEEVENAIENPIESRKFSEILAQNEEIVFITENLFRQARSDIILPPLVEKAEDAGVDVSVVVGNGKAPGIETEDEAKMVMGEEIVEKDIPYRDNNVEKEDDYVFLGVTSYGTPLWVLEEVVNADSIVTISTTQATLWGYGGSGMILPAVSGNETIEIDHIMSLAPDCVPGNNECKMQMDKYEALEMVGIDLGINVIVNNRWDTIYVNAGDPVKSHKKAVGEYNKIYEFDISGIEDRADIVITGTTGPTDHLFFHTGWAVINCEPLVREGGTIIQATPCPGIGDFPGFALMDLMAEYIPATPESQEKALKDFFEHKKEVWAGCIWYPILRTMLEADISVVTQKDNLEDAREVGLNATNSIDEAFEEALGKYGSDSKVAFAPYGRYSVFSE